MAKVKLDLKSKKDDALRTFAKEHQAAMVGNVNFVTPSPTAEAFDGVLVDYSDNLDAIAAAETALQTLRSRKEELRGMLEASLNGRGSYVEIQSGGLESMILSAAFQVHAPSTPTTSLDAPTGLVATMGKKPGKIELSCDALFKAKTYLYEMREYMNVEASWTQVKFGTRSSATVSGLVTGKKYAFRVSALGPNDLESPWSAEAVCMAP